MAARLAHNQEVGGSSPPPATIFTLMNLHTVTQPKCPVCLGHGLVCDAHPDLAWGPGLPSEYFPGDRVCWCGAGARPCPRSVKLVLVPLDDDDTDDDDTEPTRHRSDLWDMLKWALVAAGITLVFGVMLNVLEAVFR